MEGIKKPPRRVQLLFDHFVTTKEQKLKGAHGIMVLIHANENTVSEFFQDICDHFGLRCTSSHGPILKLNGSIIPGFQQTSIFRDLDKIIVEGDFIKKRKKKAVATEKEKKEVRKRPLPEETGLKREQEDTSPKNKRVASINDMAWTKFTGFRGGPKEKNVHKVCLGNGTQQSLPSHLIPGQPRFMSPDVTNSNCTQLGRQMARLQMNESTPPQQNGWDAWEPKH